MRTDFAIGQLHVNLIQRRVFVGDEERTLTRREFDLLAALAKAPGRAVSYDELYATVWASKTPYAYRRSRVIASAVHRLRDQLGLNCIDTLYGYGLRLVAVTSADGLVQATQRLIRGSQFVFSVNGNGSHECTRVVQVDLEDFTDVLRALARTGVK